jgi:uncharacterized protein YjlB
MTIRTFISNAHEVLGIAEGQVSVKLGGKNGRPFRLKAGDMLVLPAGIGHCRVELAFLDIRSGQDSSRSSTLTIH